MRTSSRFRSPRRNSPVWSVDAFVEKPDAKTARSYITSGYLWNSGNFVTPAGLLLAELAAFEPAVRDFPEGQGSLSGRFPNQAMEDQIKEYLAWTGEGNSGLFYAFRAVQFN